jgi:hypothetical protein
LACRAGPNAIAAVGLIAGLIAGLTFARVINSRSGTTI